MDINLFCCLFAACCMLIRTLLESSKTFLDKGKPEDDVNYGTKVYNSLSYVMNS